MTAPTHSTERRRPTNTIHPGHAWMLGLLVGEDGSFVPTCTCPDFCELDHEFD